jgi:hypothetical protein
MTDKNAVRWHLQGNLYPRVPVVMADAAIEAIEAVQAGDDARMIELPPGATLEATGAHAMTAGDIVEWLRLADFVGIEATE